MPEPERPSRNRSLRAKAEGKGAIMDLHLKGRVAAVAASSAGLGFATAHALAEEGCKIALCGRRADKLEDAAAQIWQETGAKIFTVNLDISDTVNARRFVRETAEHFGGLDIVVANAGGPPSGVFTQMTETQWQDALRTNFLATVAMFHEALPYVQKSDQGRLVAITSLSGKQPMPNLVLSNAARAAVHGMVKTLSREVAASGVTVNAVCPGHIQTDRQIELAEHAAAREGISTEEVLSRRAQGVPLARIGDPMELGATIAFLCSKQAAYISGVALLVDGGVFAGLP